MTMAECGVVSAVCDVTLQCCDLVSGPVPTCWQGRPTFCLKFHQIVWYKTEKSSVGGGSVGDNEGWVWSVTISYLDTTGGQKLVRQPVRLKLVLTEIISRSSFKQWSKCSLAQAALLCLISDEYWEKRSLKKGFSSTTEHFPPGLFLSPYDLS